MEEPLESTAVEEVREEADIPSASDSQEQFPSSQAEEDETPIEEKQAEAPAVSGAVGGDELSISFDVTPQTAPAEVIEEAESSDDKEELTTSEESAVSESAVEIKVSEEETSAAPLPMPGRRPPRRHSRFQNTIRSNHSLRHLWRF